jgi:hypothetical protein
MNEQEIHHPEGVTEQDHAYRDKVKERIRTGQDPARPSAVVMFANHLSELAVKFSLVGSSGLRWTCGCEVEFGDKALIVACEGHK